MASSIIHIAIAKKVESKLKVSKKEFLLGSIAPDLSKQLGQTKRMSHFLDDGTQIPNLERFLNKYRFDLQDSFVLGYYVHLLGDYFWFKYFIPEIVRDDTVIKKLDGTIVHCNSNMLQIYIYNDYTNMNKLLIDKYELESDLEMIYEDLPPLKNIIEEIPMNKIDIIVSKTKEIIDNSKIHKDLVFNLENIDRFIDTACTLIIADLEANGLID